MGGVPRYIFPAHMETVQTFGRKREAVAVAFVEKGKGLIKVNGVPIELVQPESLRFKVWEPVLLLGANRYREVDIRIRVKGGGYTAQIYAIRQAIGKLPSPGTKNMLMRLPSVRLSRSSSSMIALSLWLILA